jgi:hypothetical protein
MLAAMRTAIALVALLTVSGVGCSSCQQPGGGGGIGNKLISCTTEAVSRNWPTVLPGVNTCLTDTGPDSSVSSCLLGLINPAINVTEDVIACVLRDQGRKFGEMAARNENDLRSARAAHRANAFMVEREYRFQDGGAQ